MTVIERLRWRWLNERLRKRPTTCGYIFCDNPLPAVPIRRRHCSEACATGYVLWSAEMCAACWPLSA